MKKRVKRALSVLLVSFLFTQEVLADVDAAAPASLSVATVSDAEEPFYYDEDGNKIYDSDIDWSQYRTEPDYSDIMWTFEEYPETMMVNGDMDTYIVGVDDAVVVAIVAAACAACGVAIARSDIPEFVSKGFEPWLRRNKGADAATMNIWQSLFKTTVGTSFVGMKVLTKNINEFLQSLTMSDTTVSVPINSSVRGTPMCPFFDIEKFVYIDTFFSIYDGYIEYYDFCYRVSDFEKVIGGYLGTEYPESYYSFSLCLSSANVGRYDNLSAMYRYSQKYYDEGYWDKGAYPDSNYMGRLYLETCYTFDFPVFVNKTAFESWFNYGTTGGLVNGDVDDFLSINTANQWTDLKQDFLTRWAVSDTFNVPATQDALDTLVDSLSKSQTGADVITNLNTVWTITDNNGGDVVVPPSAAYSSLCYILSALAGYAGVTLTDVQKDSFITSFYTGNIDGTAALVDEQAQAIVRNFVVINGGSQSPDDNNDNNKYKVLKKLAVSLGAFLVSAGLVSDSPDFDNEPSVSNNVQVVEKQSPDVPTPSPDTGTDLTGVLGYLKQFLDILLAWANPLSLMDSLVSKLGLPTISDGIKSTIKTLPKLISGELTLPELFGNVTDAIFSMPQQVADAIAHALGMETGLEDVLTTVLELLGLSGLYNLTADIYNWLLSNNFVDLSGLQKLLSDIKNGILSIPDAMTNILNEIRSIPGQITDFFTIDTAVLSDAFADLQTTFVSRFSGISQLASVFNRDYSFNTVYPVIKMQIPEDPPILRQMFDGKSEIVFLDLNPFAENLAYVRSIIVAMLYVAFAFWFLGEFDVKFHIG